MSVEISNVVRQSVRLDSLSLHVPAQEVGSLEWFLATVHGA